MLSLTRSIAWRVSLVTFKSTAPIALQRSPLVKLPSYRALSTTPTLFAAARATAKSPKTAGRAKAKPKTNVNAKPKTKVKPRVKGQAKPKRKVAAKSKPKVSTRVPLAKRPPKRPSTPFVLFYNRVFPSPGSRPGGVTSASKEAGEAWRNLPELEKKAFQDEARILLNNYITQRDKWYKKPENLLVLRTLNKDRKKRGKKRIHTPRTVGPKKPLPAFLRFAQELRDTNRLSPNDAPEGISGSRLMWAARESGNRWNELPASEKEKYNKAYHADLAKWKAANSSTSATA